MHIFRATFTHPDTGERIERFGAAATRQEAIDKVRAQWGAIPKVSHNKRNCTEHCEGAA